MKFIETGFDGLFVIEPEIKGDSRGSFTRLFCKREFNTINFNKEFVQENLTFTKIKGTFRGLHYQNPPYCEVKLVRCLKGNVLDIVVDLRKSSKTFLKSFSIELQEEKLNMLLIPEGFAHGFQTLTNDCLMLYLHTNFYNPQYERVLNIADPILNCKLPLNIKEISERDKNSPFVDSDFIGVTL